MNLWDNKEKVQPDAQFFEQMSETALAGKNSNFEFVRNVESYFTLKSARSGLKKIILLYKKLCKKVLKQYCSEVKNGLHNFALIYKYTQFRKCVEFYTAELKIAEDMNQEYWAYCDHGHYLEQWLFFRERPEELCHDFRQKSQDTSF